VCPHLSVCVTHSLCLYLCIFLYVSHTQALYGDCGFMAANLYARSIFGEDALANLSIERPVNQADATVTGHIRIRAKSQVPNTGHSLTFIALLCVAFVVVSRG